MLGGFHLIVILALLAGALWLAVRAFERPQGVYVKSLVRAVLAIVGGLGLIVLLSPWIGSGAGMGVFFIFLTYIALLPTSRSSSLSPRSPASRRPRVTYGTP
jgi:hypothetical protein